LRIADLKADPGPNPNGVDGAGRRRRVSPRPKRRLALSVAEWGSRLGHWLFVVCLSPICAFLCVLP